MTDLASPLRIPWTGEFSPGQLGPNALSETLQIVASNAGQRATIVEAMRSRWFSDGVTSRANDPKKQLTQQSKRANNVLIGMQAYGLLAGTELSNLGEEILSLGTAAARHELFVQHLLRHRQGLELLELVKAMQQRGVVVKNETIRQELRNNGYVVNVNSGDPGKLRNWLSLSGVVDRKWAVDDVRLGVLLGTPVDLIGEWQSLTKAQRAFLASIRRLSETRGQQDVPSTEIVSYVTAEHGNIFNEGQIAKIYQALEKAGWIKRTRASTGGRNGKGGQIAATPKLIQADFEILVGFRPGNLPADLRAVMTKPLSAVYDDLGSSDTYVKGIALELLTVNLAIDLGLTPLQLRVRGVKTGGAEVDLIAEAAHLNFSRWLFQCKNTQSVDVGVLAKEIGMATLLQAHVIVIATTGTFSQTVITYSARVMQTTPFQTVLVDGSMLQTYQRGGALALREVFRKQARTALSLKRPQVLDTLEELVNDEDV